MKGVDGVRYDPLDYLYASARIRAMEGRLVGRERLNQLLSAQTVSDAEKMLDEWGASKGQEYGLKGAFAAVAESLPDRSLLHFLQYPYDCHNLKTLEKCRIKGTDPERLLIDLGSVPTEILLTVSENELLSRLPTHMAQAVALARDAFAKTGDPQELDFIFDRAAYADMAAAAAPYPFAAELVGTQADLINLMMCLRLLRMQNGELGRSVLTRAALPAGTLDELFLLDLYDGGEEAFYKRLSATPYEAVFAKDRTLADTEKRADDHLMALIRRARYVTFGAEVPIAYLLAAERQSKNLRILLVGKAAGLDAQAIQTRMRESYV